MKPFLFIFLGGGTGSILRYYLGRLLQGYFTSGFPAGTLGVNIFACFLIGLISGMIDSGYNISPATRLLLITGFCGGFSTFSAFSIESLKLFQEGRYFYLVVYLTLSLVFCILAVFGGLIAGSKI